MSKRIGRAPSAETVRLLFIMGFARSGSTLLDTVLGAHPSVFGAGELCNIIRNVTSRRHYCACGALGGDCPFWSEVLNEWTLRIAGQPYQYYSEDQRRYERLRAFPSYMVRGHLDRSETWERYVKATQGLLGAIRSLSRSAIVVDSSKKPLRALALSRMPLVDLRVVHLVRDVRGVAFSLTKAFEASPRDGIATRIDPCGPLSVAAQWSFLNAIGNRVRSRLGEQAILVRYEDLVADPVRELERIGALCGLGFSELGDALQEGMTIPSSHSIAGNRMRMKREVKLEPDMEWQKRLSILERHALGVVAGPLALRYGYPI